MFQSEYKVVAPVVTDFWLKNVWKFANTQGWRLESSG